MTYAVARSFQYSGERSESGYALIAAVACIAIFAAVALAILSATRISIASGSGEMINARARLAADAGVEMALHGLTNGDEFYVALLGGGEKSVFFENVRLTIRLFDERGKIPTNRLEQATVARMLSMAGRAGPRLEVARASLMDWQDPDEEPQPDGAEAAFYAPDKISPRDSALMSIEELGKIRGFSPRLVASLRPMVTVDPDAIPFDSSYALPQAIAVMNEGGEGSPEEIQRQREADGQRTALGFLDRKSMIGRPITISVDADTADHGHFQRKIIIVITGRPVHPYVVHRVD